MKHSLPLTGILLLLVLQWGCQHPSGPLPPEGHNFVFLGTQYRGTFRSTDHGATWKATTSSDSSDPFGYWATDFKACGSTIFASTLTKGLLRSSDDGATWFPVTSLGEKSLHKIGSIGTLMLLGCEYNSIFLTSDQGAQWFQTDTHFLNTRAFLQKGKLLFMSSQQRDTTVPGLIGKSCIARSIDSGRSWQVVETPYMAECLVLFGSDIIAASDPGLLISSDDGLTWKIQTSKIEHFSGVTTCGQDLYAIASNGGPGLFRSTDEGVSWTQIDLTAVFNAEAHDLSCIASDGKYIFVGTSFQGLLRSTDSGETWSRATTGIGDSTLRTISLGFK